MKKVKTGRLPLAMAVELFTKLVKLGYLGVSITAHKISGWVVSHYDSKKKEGD